jgi:hypothetical protein
MSTAVKGLRTLDLHFDSLYIDSSADQVWCHADCEFERGQGFDFPCYQPAVDQFSGSAGQEVHPSIDPSLVDVVLDQGREELADGLLLDYGLGCENLKRTKVVHVWIAGIAPRTFSPS